jgi:hypothetical protein
VDSAPSTEHANSHAWSSCLDQLIESQDRAIRYYQIFAVGLFAFGSIVLMTGAFLFLLSGSGAGSDPIKIFIIVGISGGFVASLSALPIREIMNRRGKVEIFKVIHEWSKVGDVADLDENKRINNLIWQAVEKTALG